MGSIWIMFFVLPYADDLEIIAETRIESQSLLDKLRMYCKKWKMKDKSY